MKKVVLQIAVFMMMAVPITASNLTFELSKEPNVNDIPFDTKSLASYYLLISDNDEKIISKEKNVDDIPFDTKMIASEALYNNYQNISMQEEAYADDIPFNTMCCLFDNVAFYDLKAQRIHHNAFYLILQLPFQEEYTFTDPQEFKKNLLKCVIEKPEIHFKEYKGIQHNFPQY